MIGTGAALLGSAIIGGGASMFGASQASKAQTRAAEQAAALQREAMQFQRDNYNAAAGNLDPYIQGGKGASNLLQSFYGLNGNQALGDSALERFRQSPDYQFSLKEGMGALENSASAKGNVLGGNQIRAATEYGSGLASQNLGNYLTRLSGMAGQGIQSSGYLGQIGTGTGSSMGTSATAQGNALMAGGTAEASGYLGMAKGFNSALSGLSLYNQLGKSSYAPSGGAFMGSTGGYNGNQIGGLY